MPRSFFHASRVKTSFESRSVLKNGVSVQVINLVLERPGQKVISFDHQGVSVQINGSDLNAFKTLHFNA
jgi:hypothetical protein